MVSDRNVRHHGFRPQKRGIFSVITVLVVIIAVSFLSFSSFGSNSGAEPTLRYLSILHRHGERAPKPHTYPLDPYSNESYWPVGKGQLLQKGVKTLFEVGKGLRRRYDGFIPSKYKASELLVLSSDYDRCIMSVQALLAGLYPPVEDQIWNSEIQWHPIPIHPIPPSIDNLFTGKMPCSRLKQEADLIKSAQLKKIQDENQELLDYLNKNAGVVVQSIRDVSDVYDALLIAHEQGLQLPEWALDVYPAKLLPMRTMSIKRLSWTPTMKKLYSGSLINDVVTNMKKKRDSKETLKRLLTLYSAHDSTLFNFLISMGVTQEIPLPNYGAAVILELHEIESKYRVKILYLNGLGKENTVLHIKGCENDRDTLHDDMCDLDVFTSLVDPVRVTDFKKECELSDKL